MHFLTRWLHIHRYTGPYSELNLRIDPDTLRTISQWRLKHAWLVNKSLKRMIVRTYQWISPLVQLYFYWKQRKTPRPTHSFLLILLENPFNTEEIHFLALHRRCQVEIQDFQLHLSVETKIRLLENAKKWSERRVILNHHGEEEIIQLGTEMGAEMGIGIDIQLRRGTFSEEIESELESVENLAELDEKREDSASSMPVVHPAQYASTSIPPPVDASPAEYYSPDPTGPAPPGISDSAIVDSIYHIHPISYTIIPRFTLEKFLWALQHEFVYSLSEYQLLNNNCKTFVEKVSQVFFGALPHVWQVCM